MIIPLLLLLDLFFMVITVSGGYISVFMLFLSFGKIKMQCYHEIQDRIFYWVFNMRKNDIEGFRRARNISQLLYETIPQVALQTRMIFWIWNNPENRLAKLDIKNQLIASIASGVVHALMELFQIYHEAAAADLGVLQYGVVCLNGRFDWLPYEEVIQSAIMEQERGQNEPQRDLELNFGQLNTRVCGMEFGLEIKQTQAGLRQLTSLFNQMKPL